MLFTTVFCPPCFISWALTFTLFIFVFSNTKDRIVQYYDQLIHSKTFFFYLFYFYIHTLLPPIIYTGLSSEAYTGTETHHTPGYRIKLVALPERYLYVYTTSAPNHHVKGYMMINNKPANIQRVYVKSVDRMIGLPKVEYIELHGYYDDNSIAYEKVKQ